MTAMATRFFPRMALAAIGPGPGWRRPPKTRSEKLGTFRSYLTLLHFSVALDRENHAWGSVAKTFFNTCVALAGDDRGIGLYHWSSERFSAAWKTTISVLVAKGRARVSVAAAATDWPKRIRDLQFLDHEGDPTAA